jgi:hypothetical protein
MMNALIDKCFFEEMREDKETTQMMEECIISTAERY